MNTINIISRGVALCKKDPSPMSQCEGFNPTEKYMFERCETLTVNSEDGHLPAQMKYVRLYESAMNPEETSPLNFSPPFGYETIGPGIFKRCFEIVSEQGI